MLRKRISTVRYHPTGRYYHSTAPTVYTSFRYKTISTEETMSKKGRWKIGQRVRGSSVTRGDSRWSMKPIACTRIDECFVRLHATRSHVATYVMCVCVHLHRTTGPSYGNACLSIRDLFFPTATTWRKFPLTTRKHIYFARSDFFLLLFQPLRDSKKFL